MPFELSPASSSQGTGFSCEDCTVELYFRLPYQKSSACHQQACKMLLGSWGCFVVLLGFHRCAVS